MLSKWWCWRRLLRVPSTARKSNQSFLKETNLEYSLEGLCWSWSSNTLATWCEEPIHWKRPRFWGRQKAGGEGVLVKAVGGSFLRNIFTSELSKDFSSVQLLSCVRLFVHQASLSITNSRSLPNPMSIELVMQSNHLILCRLLLLLPSIFPSIAVFSNDSDLHIRWPKYWSFSFNISPSNEYPGLISFRMNWLDLLAVQGTLKSLLQHHALRRRFHVRFRKRWNSLFWDEMSYRYQLGLTGLLYHLKFVFPC